MLATTRNDAHHRESHAARNPPVCRPFEVFLVRLESPRRPWCPPFEPGARACEAPNTPATPNDRALAPHRPAARPPLKAQST